jgi:hypothetical protein
MAFYENDKTGLIVRRLRGKTLPQIEAGSRYLGLVCSEGHWRNLRRRFPGRRSHSDWAKRKWRNAKRSSR